MVNLLPSRTRTVVAVVAGVHWLGVAIAIGVFAVWCARLPASGGSRQPLWGARA